MCNLLGTVGVIVQSLLGLLAFSVLLFKVTHASAHKYLLLIKRYRENPKRERKVWIFDLSKQGVAATLIHVFNVFFADYLTTHTTDKDPCTWYFMNIIVDATLGLFIVWSLLKVY